MIASQPTSTPTKSEKAIAELNYALMCPIAFIPFQDPVLLSDGHTYERSSITEWFTKSRSQNPLAICTSPVTRQPLFPNSLTPNIALRSVIRPWQQVEETIVEKDQYISELEARIAELEGDVEKKQEVEWKVKHDDLLKSVKTCVSAYRRKKIGRKVFLERIAKKHSATTHHVVLIIVGKMQRKTKLREQLVAKRPTPVFDPIENYNKILSCPINWTPFEDPVVAADEHTYERAPLTRWLYRGGQIFNPATSPVTGVRLTSRVMTSNEVIKKLSRAWNRRGINDPTPELKKILTCPLSGKLFVDPVLCVDGYSYERDHIKKHYEIFTGYPTSPVTKQPLYFKQIVSNITVLHAVKGLETLKGVDWSYDEPEKYNGSCMSMKEMSEVLDEYSGFDDDFFIN